MIMFLHEKLRWGLQKTKQATTFHVLFRCKTSNSGKALHVGVFIHDLWVHVCMREFLCVSVCVCISADCSWNTTSGKVSCPRSPLWTPIHYLQVSNLPQQVYCGRWYGLVAACHRCRGWKRRSGSAHTPTHSYIHFQIVENKGGGGLIMQLSPVSSAAAKEVRTSHLNLFLKDMGGCPAVGVGGCLSFLFQTARHTIDESCRKQKQRKVSCCLSETEKRRNNKSLFFLPHGAAFHLCFCTLKSFIPCRLYRKRVDHECKKVSIS